MNSKIMVDILKYIQIMIKMRMGIMNMQYICKNLKVSMKIGQVLIIGKVI